MAAASLLLRRSCKVLAHETVHLPGIAHCVFYSYLMTGSNHFAERPLGGSAWMPSEVGLGV